MRFRLKSAQAEPTRSVHRVNEPVKLSLSKVASSQCRFRFARQVHRSSATTFGLNFRVCDHPVETAGVDQICGIATFRPQTSDKLTSCVVQVYS